MKIPNRRKSGDSGGSDDVFVDTVSELPGEYHTASYKNDGMLGGRWGHESGNTSIMERWEENMSSRELLGAKVSHMERQDSGPCIYEDPAGPGPYRHILKEVINSTGQYAFGVVAIEIWILKESGPTGAALERADGGWWHDPTFPTCEALKRLEGTVGRNPFTRMSVPGWSLPSILWEDAVKNKNDRMDSWRDLRDIPMNEHTSIMADLFGLATGLIFLSRNVDLRGIAIFYARRSVDIDRLSSEANKNYLQSSTELLGNVVAWDAPRRDAVKERRKYLDAAMQRIKTKILVLHRTGILETFLDSVKEVEGEERGPRNREQRVSLQSFRSLIPFGLDLLKAAKTKAIATPKKIFKGGGQRLPPALSPSRYLKAWLGCVLSLLTSSAINEAISHHLGGKFKMPMPPLGALVTMHYGFSSSPASQPWNSIFGTVVMGGISKLFTYIPINILPKWVRVAIGPSFAIATSLFMGLPHPPGGATAVIVQENDVSWLEMCLLLLGYAETIVFSVIFINLISYGTFPMYWAPAMPLPSGCKSKYEFGEAKEGSLERSSERQ